MITMSELRMLNTIFEKDEKAKQRPYLDLPNFTIRHAPGGWGDSDLTYTDADGVEWVFDNEDIQESLYSMWRDEHPDDPDPSEDVYADYVRGNVEAECLECIACGYFRDGSHNWHDTYQD